MAAATDEAVFLDAATRLLAEKFTQLGDFKDSFLSCDLDQDGFLSISDLAFACEQAGLSLTDQELSAVQTTFDANGDGRVDFNDFAITVQRIAQSEALTKSLQRSDQDITALLSLAEQRGVFRAYPVSQTAYGQPRASAQLGGNGVPAPAVTATARDARVSALPTNTVARVREMVAGKHRSPADAFAAYQLQSGPYLSVQELLEGLHRRVEWMCSIR